LRLLALDIGEKTIGVAVTDSLGMIPRPLKTLKRQGIKVDLTEIEQLVEEFCIGKIIVGYPLHVSGEKSDAVRRVEKLAGKLKRRLNIPIAGVDERYTTLEAKELLSQEWFSDRSQKRGTDKDSLAAVIILRRYLEEVGSIVKEAW